MVEKKQPTQKPSKPAAVKRSAVRKAVVAKVKTPKVEAAKTKTEHKIVRDSFSMPQPDYDLLAELKLKAKGAGVKVKRSELLRMGLQAMSKLSVTQLKQAISQLQQPSTRRPKK